MGYQFAHLSTFAKRPSAKKDGGLSVRQVLEKAARVEGECPHVPAPQLPQVVMGMGPAEALAEHDRRFAAAKQAMRGRGRGQGLRQDAHTLAAVVLSHPTPCRDLSDSKAQAEYEAWRADAVEWARQTLEAQGLDVLGTVEHTDEQYPHIHVYAVPRVPEPESDARFDARAGHLGWSTKRQASPHDAKAAYCRAMRAWQDDYQAQVGAPHGLTRLGPARRRLSRDAWQAEQAAAKAAQEAHRRAEEVYGVAQEAEAQAQRDRLSARQERQSAETEREEAAADGRAMTLAVQGWASGEILDADPEDGGRMWFRPDLPPDRVSWYQQTIGRAWQACCAIIQRFQNLVERLPEPEQVEARQDIADNWEPPSLG